VRETELVAGPAGGEDGLGGAAGALRVRPLGIEPQAERHADRVRAGPQQCDGAVDAAAHRDRDALRVARRAEDRADRVREPVDGELVAADRRRFQQGQALERALEPIGVGADDAIPLDAETDEAPLGSPGGVSDDLDHGAKLAGEHMGPHPRAVMSTRCQA
jgi:hypothetical protein